MMELQRIENSALVTRPGGRPLRVRISKRLDYLGPQGYEYCTHLEVMREDESTELIFGRYDLSFHQAVDDYERRIRWLIAKPNHAKARRSSS